eukprot:NODE_124_length_17341_cov_0.560028.p8 type:complete len:227 gc:universal NODE_124_length_17341_cov_0.560028:17016-16336(-)
MKNVEVLLGKSLAQELTQKYTLAELSSIPGSYLYRNPTIKNHPYFNEYDVKLERQITKLICNKLTLCARLDLQKEHQSDGKYGQECRKFIESRLDKMMEPPPLTKKKAIVIHTEIKKQRGGKRKVRHEQTQIQKMKNRIGFNIAQKEDVELDDAEDLGMIKPNTNTLNNDKPSKLLSKSAKERLARIQNNVNHQIPTLPDLPESNNVNKKLIHQIKVKKKSKWFDD